MILRHVSTFPPKTYAVSRYRIHTRHRDNPSLKLGENAKVGKILTISPFHHHLGDEERILIHCRY